MKIMFCIGSLSKGGAERVVCNLSNSLIDENEVSIVTTIKCESEYTLNSKINLLSLDESTNISNFVKKNILRLKRLKQIINTEKPDVILSFLPEPSYRTLLVAKNIPVIVSVRNDPKVEYKNFINKLVMKCLYRKASGFVFQTNEAKEYFSKKIQDRSVVIANPVDDVFFETKKGKSKDIIVTVGRLTPQKNHKMLIEAFSEIVKKYPNYKLQIYGTGPMEDELNALISSLNLNKNVVLCGTTTEVYNVLKDKKMFVLSSDYEGMPNALMEALTVGLPCVSTDCPCGGPNELIKNNKNGILVPVNDKEKLIKAIEKLIKDEKLCSKLSVHAKENSLKYKNGVITNKWYKYVKEVVNHE